MITLLILFLVIVANATGTIIGLYISSLYEWRRTELKDEARLDPLSWSIEWEKQPMRASKVKVLREKPTPKKRWSKVSDRCLDCGTTKRPPHGRGMCRRCYTRATRRKAA